MPLSSINFNNINIIYVKFKCYCKIEAGKGKKCEMKPSQSDAGNWEGGGEFNGLSGLPLSSCCLLRTTGKCSVINRNANVFFSFGIN